MDPFFRQSYGSLFLALASFRFNFFKPAPRRPTWQRNTGGLGDGHQQLTWTALMKCSRKGLITIRLGENTMVTKAVDFFNQGKQQHITWRSNHSIDRSPMAGAVALGSHRWGSNSLANSPLPRDLWRAACLHARKHPCGTVFRHRDSDSPILETS